MLKELNTKCLCQACVHLILAILHTVLGDVGIIGIPSLQHESAKSWKG